MTDIIIIAAIVLIVGLAALYVYKAKRKGKCIGCPHSATCSKNSCGQSNHLAGGG